MANKQTSIISSGTNIYKTPSLSFNRIATDFITPGVVGSFTSTTGAFAATQTGGGNMSVTVLGQATPQYAAYVSATPTGGVAGTYGVTMDASEAVTIPNNSSGSTVYDFVYIKLDPTNMVTPAVNGLNVASLVTLRSTTNYVNTPPYYGQSQTGSVINMLLLAVVTVANSASSILTANIADVRVQAGANAVATGAITAPMLGTGAITLGYAQSASSYVSAATTQTLMTGLTTTVTIPAGGRRIKITGFSPAFSDTAVAAWYIGIWDGAVGSGTQLSLSQGYMPTLGTGNAGMVFAIVLPAAGTKTYSIGVHTNAGTLTSGNTAIAPAFILVEAI